MSRPALRRKLGFLAACCLAVPGGAGAADTLAVIADAPAVTLIAPDSVRAFLTRHVDLQLRPNGDAAQAALLRRAGRELGELLATEGYFTPRIELRPASEPTAAPAIEVVPGPRTRVESSAIEFLGDLAGDGFERAAQRERLRAAWPLQPGAALRSDDWEAAKAALLAGVVAADHVGARIVASRAEVDPARAAARLAVTLDSGPAYRFGPIGIAGLKRYDAALVQSLAPFAPGDAFRREQLLAFQARLQNTPWFHSVMVEADPAAAVGAALPVQVTLAEVPAQRVGFGAGYGTNSGARGELNYRHHDWLGRAWDFGSGLRVEQKRQALFADLGLLPDADGYRLAFGGRLEASDIQGLATTRQVLGANRSRSEGRIETRLGLEWQREERRPDGAAAAIDRALVLDWRWIRRAVDDVLDPRRGNVIELRLGGASKNLLSERDFVRSHLRVQQWWPLGRRDTLSLRGELGITVAVALSGIPQDYLFRAGGTQSLRGYAYQSLGVREGTAVVGGRALALGSLEYTRWLAEKWGAAVFFDAGNAADEWRNLKAVTGAGIGARWKSPAGPLALDLAHGRESGAWQLHFSLLVAF